MIITDDHRHYVINITAIKTPVIIITTVDRIIRVTDQVEYARDRAEMSECDGNYRFNCHYNGIY